MTVLRIEHGISDYEIWKKEFDRDPVNRKGLGVRNYRIYRPEEDDKLVTIELEFDNRRSAETALEALKKIWTRVDGTLIFSPDISFLKLTESKTI